MDQYSKYVWINDSCVWDSEDETGPQRLGWTTGSDWRADMVVPSLSILEGHIFVLKTTSVLLFPPASSL